MYYIKSSYLHSCSTQFIYTLSWPCSPSNPSNCMDVPYHPSSGHVAIPVHLIAFVVHSFHPLSWPCNPFKSLNCMYVSHNPSSGYASYAIHILASVFHLIHLNLVMTMFPVAAASSVTSTTTFHSQISSFQCEFTLSSPSN